MDCSTSCLGRSEQFAFGKEVVETDWKVICLSLFIWDFTSLSTLMMECHVMMDSFVGRGNQYIQLVKILYCKLLTIGKQLPLSHIRSEV